MFDVSQTEGEPLPEIGVNELAGDVRNYEYLFTALERVSPVPIVIGDIPNGAKGYYDRADKRIVINDEMSELQTLKTAVHEITHARIHDIDRNADKNAPRPDRKTLEVEAESVAYTVCQHFGIDTSDYSFGYIAGWSGGKNMDVLKASGSVKKNAQIRFAVSARMALTGNGCVIENGLQMLHVHVFLVAPLGTGHMS